MSSESGWSTRCDFEGPCLACSSQFAGRADRSPAARLDEHRLSKKYDAFGVRVRREKEINGPFAPSYPSREQRAIIRANSFHLFYLFLPSDCCNNPFHSSRLTAGSVVI